jgi:outer membrane receptor protein involved in Fe transport
MEQASNHRVLKARIRDGIVILLGVLCMAACIGACAQGGPPMVTDDPGTPGDGHWEINLATIGSRTTRGWDVDVIDADINYGWGDRVQLKLDAPWSYLQTEDGGTDWGLGAVNVGVKWRFVDRSDEFPLSVSTYPQYLSAWSNYAKKRGLASPDDAFFLPVEVATEAGGFEFTAELGRNFIQNESDQWEGGIVAGHGCGPIECLIEIHRISATDDAQTLLNLGLTWKLSDSLVLLASAGREFGSRATDHQDFLCYFGFQILR